MSANFLLIFPTYINRTKPSRLCKWITLFSASFYWGKQCKTVSSCRITRCTHSPWPPWTNNNTSGRLISRACNCQQGVQLHACYSKCKSVPNHSLHDGYEHINYGTYIGNELTMLCSGRQLWHWAFYRKWIVWVILKDWLYSGTNSSMCRTFKELVRHFETHASSPRVTWKCQYDSQSCTINTKLSMTEQISAVRFRLNKQDIKLWFVRFKGANGWICWLGL